MESLEQQILEFEEEKSRLNSAIQLTNESISYYKSLTESIKQELASVNTEIPKLTEELREKKKLLRSRQSY